MKLYTFYFIGNYSCYFVNVLGFDIKLRFQIYKLKFKNHFKFDKYCNFLIKLIVKKSAILII